MGGWFDSDKPAAPNLAGANEAGVWANVESLGIQKLVANAAKFGKSITLKVPTFDSKGNKQLDPQTGDPKLRDVTYDFKGYSDADATREEMEFGGEAADFMAKTMLEVQQKYGKDFVKQRIEELKAADPTGYEVREMLGEAAKADLARGTELSPEMAKQVTQQELAGQSARGNIYGSAPAAAEAMALGDAGFRMRQQRLANAASFLSGSTPVAQFGQISGAQQGASPFNPMGIQSGIGVNPNAGAQGQQFATNAYNTQMNYAAEQQPIGAQLLGLATGVATGKIADKLLG